MKKKNFKLITLIAVLALIVSGWFSSSLVTEIDKAFSKFVDTPVVGLLIDDLEDAAQNISYKYTMIDIYSYLCRIANIKTVKKADATVVRMDNDYLAFDETKYSIEQCEDMARQCSELSTVANDLNIPLIYAMAPTKLYFDDEEDNHVGIARQNYDNYLSALRDRNINVLDLANAMNEQNLIMEDSYFITDHHWIPETGLWASHKICEELANKSDFSYDEQIFDLNSYEVNVYEDWFLGSAGKKVGRFFSSHGVDDISIITPKFDTELVITDNRGTLTGDFANTVMDMSHVNEKSLYTNNCYAAYSGGDFGLQIIENKLANKDAKELVVIRDSFACVVTPFLSLSTSKIHIVDTRYWHGQTNAETVLDYIKAVQPDGIVVLYSIISPDLLEFGSH